MIKQSTKAAKLFEKIFDSLLEDEDTVYDAISSACKLDSFESNERLGEFLSELPVKMENLTFFFDPGDGAYGHMSPLSEEELLEKMKAVGKKYDAL